MKFKDALRNNSLLLGTVLTIPSVEVAEILSASSLDWLFIDLEHSAMTTYDVQRLLQVAGARRPCLVRLAESSEVEIKKALDAGARGVILPQIQSAKQLEEAISWARFAPDGQRSVGLSRASGYGLHLKDYLSKANEETVVVALIEHVNAVNQIDEILTVPGCDAIFVGPYDLSASLDVAGEIDNSLVQRAITHVSERCRAARMPLGIFCPEGTAAKEWIQKGFTLVAVGSDGLFLTKGLNFELSMLEV